MAGGEGVFGLQRALHLAGTRNVVASLWAVDDRLTRSLMKAFYARWFSGAPSVAEALRRAQLEILEHGLGDSADPIYWAGWVVSGGPGLPIDAPTPGATPAVTSSIGSTSRAAWLLPASTVTIAALVLSLWWRQRRRLKFMTG